MRLNLTRVWLFIQLLYSAATIHRVWHGTWPYGKQGRQAASFHCSSCNTVATSLSFGYPAAQWQQTAATCAWFHVQYDLLSIRPSKCIACSRQGLFLSIFAAGTEHNGMLLKKNLFTRCILVFHLLCRSRVSHLSHFQGVWLCPAAYSPKWR